MEWSLNDTNKNSCMPRRYRVIEIVVTCLILTASCKTEKHETVFQFYYYPDKNVYFAPLKKTFWYSLDGAKTWKTYTDNNVAEPLILGQKVVLSSAVPEIYKDNENHRRLYAGRLFVIDTADTSHLVADTAVGAVERSVTEVQKPKRTIVKEQNNKPKANSISKLINKIFGKHKR